MATTLAEVLRHFGPDVLRAWAIEGCSLSTAQAKAWRAIVACRTPALGGEQLRCDGCGASQWRWHSCRNRHCPQCQARQREAWRSARHAELLDVPYCHLVFTLPHELNALAGVHPRWVYDTLMRCTAATLTEFACDARWLGGIGAFTLVLHTWRQDLASHLHVHALMACGALARDAEGAASWQPPRRDARFLFPVHALSKVFRGKFTAALQAAQAQGRLRGDPQPSPAQRAQRLQVLRTKPWVVYAKTPLAGAAAVLDYLSRYTHRTAIGNERLVDIADEAVRFRVRAQSPEAGRNGKRTTTLPGAEFVRRFLRHVLPSGFKRIRHYGLLAPAAKTERLAAARALLAMPPASPAASEAVREFMRRVAGIDIERCPYCARGRWRVVDTLLAQRGPRQLGANGSATAALTACRGPP